MNDRNFFLLMLLLFFQAVLLGQKPVKLSGRIINSKDNQSVPFATIAVQSTNLGTISDENGYFAIQLPADTCRLIISSVGFKTIETDCDSLRRAKVCSIILTEDIHNLDEVTITGEKERIARVNERISTVKISPILVAKLPNLGEVDVMRSFQLLPGISASNETSSGLYVRGGTPDQNLILFDGMTIYHVDHFYGFFSAFNANTIDDIELMKGGFQAKYGGRISSVMEITGKPADMNRINGTASLSLLSVNAAAETPVIKNKLSLQFALRRSYTDIIQSGLYNKIFDLYSNNTTSNQPQNMSGRGRMQQQAVQPVFYFYDLNSKLTWQMNDKNTLAFSFYSGKDNLDNSSTLTMGGRPPGGPNNSTSTSTTTNQTDIAGWGNVGCSGQWHSIWSSTFKSSIFISYSNYFSTRNMGSASSSSSSSGPVSGGNMKTFEDNNLKDVSLRFRNELNITDKNILEFGVENINNNISYVLRFNDTTTENNKKQTGIQTSGYFQDNMLFFNNSVEVNAGLRGTYFNVTRKFYTEPRLSLNYHITKELKFKSAWGLYNQFISRFIREDILQGSKDFWLMADDSVIPVSSATHYIAGFSYEKGNYLIDIEAYYKDMKSLTEYSSRTTSIGRPNGANRQDKFYNGKGFAQGIEFMLQKKYGLNTGWIAYTLSEVKQQYPDLNYGKAFYALHDQTHEIKAVYCRQIKHWDFAATFIYATGKPYSAPVSQYQLKLLNGSTYAYTHVSGKNALRLPDYHRADISVSYNLIGHYTDETISLSVFNIYNRKNIWYKKFTIQENDMYVTNMTYLGFTPNVTVTIKLK
jgi:ferric enterobactin receptor